MTANLGARHARTVIRFWEHLKGAFAGVLIRGPECPRHDDGPAFLLVRALSEPRRNRTGDPILTMNPRLTVMQSGVSQVAVVRNRHSYGVAAWVFDGDYASLTFAYPDHTLAKTIEEKLIELIVANPRIMRDMPSLLREAGLELVESEGTLYADIGGSRFWVGATESYGMLARSGLLPQALVDDCELSKSDRLRTAPSSGHPPTTPT
jgi:hypothetical protein